MGIVTRRRDEGPRPGLDGAALAFGIALAVIGGVYLLFRSYSAFDAKQDVGGYLHLRQLTDALVADYDSARAGAVRPYRFPGLPPFPPEPVSAAACEGVERGRPVELAAHDLPSWAAGHVSLEASRWSMSVTSEGSGDGAIATVRLTRDLDCDGTVWMLERDVRLEDGVPVVTEVRASSEGE